MTTDSTLPPLLTRILAMPAAQQRTWLAEQDVSARQRLLALVRQHKDAAKERSWDLKRDARASVGILDEANTALTYMKEVCTLVQQELQASFAEIYVQPQEAMQKIWAQAQQDANVAHQTLVQQPEAYGALKPDSMALVALPTTAHAKKVARNMRFAELWQIYTYAWQAHQFLASKLVKGENHE